MCAQISGDSPRRSSEESLDAQPWSPGTDWKNIIFYGEIKIDPAKLKMRSS